MSVFSYFRVSDTFSPGVVAYKNGNFEKAIALFMVAAKRGCTGSLHFLSFMHYYGMGVPINHDASAEFLAMELGCLKYGMLVDQQKKIYDLEQSVFRDSPIIFDDYKKEIERRFQDYYHWKKQRELQSLVESAQESRKNSEEKAKEAQEQARWHREQAEDFQKELKKIQEQRRQEQKRREQQWNKQQRGKQHSGQKRQREGWKEERSENKNRQGTSAWERAFAFFNRHGGLTRGKANNRTKVNRIRNELAKKWHPDKNQDNPKATQNMQKLNNHYDELKKRFS